MHAGEKTIIRALIKAALSRGYVVSVNDSVEWVLKRSDKLNEIIDSLGQCDEETIRFRDSDDKVVGDVFLVYGNGPWEVVCDYSANEAMESIMAEIEEVENRVEERFC